MTISFEFSLSFFWFYIPAAVSIISTILMGIIYVADNRPGQGLAALFSTFIWVILNVVVWFLYFAIGFFTGIR